MSCTRKAVIEHCPKVLFSGDQESLNLDVQVFAHHTSHSASYSICGERIPAYSSSCPNCGVRFNAAKEDEEEWDEEFDEMETWDEEEGW